MKIFYPMLAYLGGRGAAVGRFYHEHPWWYFGLIGFVILVAIWRKFS